jgi:phospholipase C
MTSALAAQSAIARAAAIDAKVRTGTIKDVQHVVVLMQENRGFDHYFGALNGVRGFADRFPIPLPGGRTVWTQSAEQRTVAPFPLDTTQTFDLMRIEGTPHNWADAQAAWDHGRMSRWPQPKTERSMAHYRPQDLPFQVALADAFTLCDAYHSSFQGGTNTNRLFLFTGTNDPLGKGGGPGITNSHDSLPGPKEPYFWTTYVERLQAAGVSWRLYQDMADNFSDNPLVGFKAFRDAHAGAPGSSRALAERAMTSRGLDQLRADVLAGALPQVSYMISTAEESEHPGPSSPAQGADYVARVIDALTADPKVWSRTVLLVMFDENDGFFDHVPPPAPPSRLEGRALAGASSVDTTGEYHTNSAPSAGQADPPALMGRPYGLGPRTPMYVISPWSRGGYVNSQVFDHTSIIQFLERRFGVMEPSISTWRRSVCGDLMSAFDFKTPNETRLPRPLPDTKATADRARALVKKTNPPAPATPQAPVQQAGPRPSRALPYALEVQPTVSSAGVVLRFANSGAAGAVFHVYDRLRLETIPRRYTVGAGHAVLDQWEGAPDAAHDLWILGPNGFHRHVRGLARNDSPVAALSDDPKSGRLELTLVNPGAQPRTLKVTPQAYAGALAPWTVTLAPGKLANRIWTLGASRGWYDLLLTCDGEPAFSRRFAGRLETGRDSITDPSMSGSATMAWT